MGSRKSQVDIDFYIGLVENVLVDAYACIPDLVHKELERDIITLRRRCACEGLKFLTESLPKLGKAFDRALETGTLTVPPGFARKAKAGRKWNIPTFLVGLFSAVFDKTGSLESCSNKSVGFIRQICYCLYKVKSPMDESKSTNTLRSFVRTDTSLRSLDRAQVPSMIRVIARHLLAKVFHGFNPEDIEPRHGPGVVADRLKGRSKYNFDFYSRHIDQLYPYASLSTGGVHSDNPSDLMAHLTWQQVKRPARVCLVPKDSRGPRIISCEPALLQYLQQGLSRSITHLLETHPLTRGYVNFKDQSINRKLALSSSISGKYATLDMKDASDRVSVDLVKLLFPEWLVPYLMATRSDETELPDGSVVKLKKFAPMGSALCFPIESLIFWALSSAVVRVKTRMLTGRVGGVYVYGDDLIVPSVYAADIISILEEFDLLFNEDKCFVHGKFRESCGLDAYNGVPVTPIRLKAYVQRGLRRSIQLRSITDCAKHFFDAACWKTAEYLWRYVESIIGPLPITAPSFEGISRSSDLLPACYASNGCKTRWNDKYHRIEVLSWVVSNDHKEKSLYPNDLVRLLHNLISGQDQPYADEVAFPGARSIKHRWVGL